MERVPATFRPCKFQTALSFTGGACTKPVPMVHRSVETESGTHTFVQIGKQQEWLWKSAAGYRAGNKTTLKRSKIFDELRVKVDERLATADDAPPAVAAASPCGGAPAPAHDPMAELEEGLSGPAPAPESTDSTPARRASTRVEKRRIAKRLSEYIVEVDMPEREPIAVKESPMKKVRLFAPLRPKNTLWIAQADCAWLARWVFDECENGGVPAVADEGEPKPGFQIRWDFAGAWEGLIAEPGVGSPAPKKMRARVDALTPKKRGDVQSELGTGVAFEDASPEQKKEATRLYLLQNLEKRLAAAQAAASDA